MPDLHSLKLQIFSDVHLEFGDTPPVSADVDVIIAAGDIGVGLQGIRWLKKFDRPVIYVLGNHEYWGEDYTGFIDKVWQESSGTNVHFLENESIVIDGTRFLGCSLWTDYHNGDHFIMKSAATGMNDFRYISDNGKELDPKRLLDAHRQSVAWLDDVLSEHHDGKTVVVTHHAPSMKSWHRDPHDGYQYCYCTDLEHMIRSFRPDLWVHGHTHRHSDYEIDGVRVYCNPRGYMNYESIEGFDLGNVVEI